MIRIVSESNFWPPRKGRSFTSPRGHFPVRARPSFGLVQPCSRRASLWPSTCPFSSPRIGLRNPVCPQPEPGLAFCLATSSWPWSFSQFVALSPHTSQRPTENPAGGDQRGFGSASGIGGKAAKSFYQQPPIHFVPRSYRAVPVDGWHHRRRPCPSRPPQNRGRRKSSPRSRTGRSTSSSRSPDCWMPAQRVHFCAANRNCRPALWKRGE
jgi:hypothetical protein